MANQCVSLARRVKIGGSWKFASPVVSDKGRVSPEIVKLGGQQVCVHGGVWYIVWYDGTAKKRKAVGPNLTHAVAERHRQEKLLGAVSAGIEIVPNDPKRPLISDQIELFFEDLDLNDRHKRTVGQYRLILDGFCKSCQKRYIDQVDRRDVLRYLKTLRKQGLSPRTVSNRFVAVQTFLKANNVRVMRKRDSPRFVETEPEVYSPEELQVFFAACHPGQRLLYDFLLKTGARMQEAMFACWSDLDLHNRTFCIIAKPNLGFRPKTWEEREIPLEEGLARALEVRTADRPAAGLIFPTTGGKPNIKMLRTLKRIARRAGLNCGECSTCLERAGTERQECERWFLHKFRATFATMHLQAGVDLRTVQSWLGHKELGSTMRYLKPARGKEARERFNRTFAGLSRKPPDHDAEGVEHQPNPRFAAPTAELGTN
jgi:integrase/recombinase XerD